MLTNNEKLYDSLKCHLKSHYTFDGYVFVHAIYEPGDDDELHEGMYHAAADLHEPGETYHVWFIVNDDDSIVVDKIERWHMG